MTIKEEEKNTTEILWYGIYKYGILSPEDICVMVEKNSAMKMVRFLAQDIVLDILIWPWWWFTTGVVLAAQRFMDTVRDANAQCAVGVWVRAIAIPMYGDTTFGGRAISVFMRIVQIILRSIWFILLLLLATIIFLFWILIPLAIAYEIVINWPAWT